MLASKRLDGLEGVYMVVFIPNLKGATFAKHQTI